MERKASFLLFFAVFFMGIHHLMVLPPFEGIDEIAHYAYARQLADTGSFPVLWESRVPTEVDTYSSQAPLYYPISPYKDAKNIVYSVFFDLEENVERYKDIYRHARERETFIPGNRLNWEAQHPPLYYMLMALLMKGTNGLSFTAQFFALRLASFLLALSGLLIGLWGSLKEFRFSVASRRHILTAFLLYPFMIPMFFGEFGRLGNDSLCLFLMGILWWLVLRRLRDERSQVLNFALGCCLALGLLTKALFLPITAGIALFFSFQFWRGRRDPDLRKLRIDNAWIIAAPIMFALLWYIYASSRTGGFAGTADFSALAERGGLIKGLNEYFSWTGLLDRVFLFLFSWSFLGTQSLVYMKGRFIFFLLIAPLWLFFRYKKSLSFSCLAEPIALPLWILLPMLGGLLFHVFIGIALENIQVTPTWYIHILLPPLAWAFAQGLAALETEGTGFGVWKALFIGNVSIFIITSWCLMTLFSGCSVRDDFHQYAFPNTWFCLDRIPLVMERLEVLGWPWMSVTCFALGLICLVVGCVWLWRPSVKGQHVGCQTL